MIIQTPAGVFSAKSLVQNKKRAGTRLISSNRIKLEEESMEEATKSEPHSAARCRVFKRVNSNKKVPKQLFPCPSLLVCVDISSFFLSYFFHRDCDAFIKHKRVRSTEHDIVAGPAIAYSGYFIGGGGCGVGEDCLEILRVACWADN